MQLHRQIETALTVDAGAGADIINFSSLFVNRPVTIDGGAGADVVDVSLRAVPFSVIELSDGSKLLTETSPFNPVTPYGASSSACAEGGSHSGSPSRSASRARTQVRAWTPRVPSSTSGWSAGTRRHAA